MPWSPNEEAFAGTKINRYQKNLLTRSSRSQKVPLLNEHAALVFSCCDWRATGKIRKGNTKGMLAGADVDREIRMNHGYEGAYRQRQVDIAKALFAKWESRERTQKRARLGYARFRQFDAPVSIVMTCENDGHDTICHFDMGAAVYGLVLAAWSRGLGSVINGQGIMQSSVVRKHANIPPTRLL